VPKLQEEAHHDAKTGLLSARRFMELLDDEVDKSIRSGKSLAVLMCDLDLFRNVNNTHGHLAGDEVLQAVAKLLKRTVRGEDLVGRFGGEEFVVLLRNADRASAAIAGERIRQEVRDAAFTVSASADTLKLTISVGVASFPEAVHDARNLLHDADLAVYRSKLSGRNRVTIAAPIEEEVNLNPDGAYLQIMESLAFALDARGATVEGRTLRVTALSLAVAREMGVEEHSSEWRAIEQASLLHDVGKLAISSSVLYKQGPLTEEEWEEMRKHPEIGWAMLNQMEMLRPASLIVLHHHEHWDGTGYPAGIAGEEIPFGARIFTVVDAYDAITSDRPYRAAQSETAAIEEIFKNSGSQFDPRVVDSLLKVLGYKRPSTTRITARV
jgi:diguanylate cyclase (GGDEF)-like protein